jgi:hypothetical protein
MMNWNLPGTSLEGTLLLLRSTPTLYTYLLLYYITTPLYTNALHLPITLLHHYSSLLHHYSSTYYSTTSLLLSTPLYTNSTTSLLLEPTWNLPGTSLEPTWNLPGTSLEPTWNLTGTSQLSWNHIVEPHFWKPHFWTILRRGPWPLDRVFQRFFEFLSFYLSFFYSSALIQVSTASRMSLHAILAREVRKRTK